jgi:7,8-dihydropterin-6-yl-methyl-4-(beta-D-ribofuranosyl)aminobenzene 5'-phosphate synthase
VNVKILYDNRAEPGFECGWGFAALIDGDTLFDTGEDAVALLANMRAFGVEPEQIRRVVLSHEDWDHTGGIAILRRCGPVDVYVPAGADRSLKDDVKSLNSRASVFEVLHDTTLDSSKFVTRPLESERKEISLAVRTNEGLVLVTGCAHPGLENIMANAREYGAIHAVIGGFHGFDRLDALADVAVIAPCHCTKKRRKILKMYPEQARTVAAGTEIRIGEET